MKLLFDQNISFRAVKKVVDFLPQATQVRLLGLEGSTDNEIWDYAKSNGYTIVTFDADFFDLSLIKGIPPKVVWLRFGNISTNDLAIKIRENHDLIRAFTESPEYKEIACLAIEE